MDRNVCDCYEGVKRVKSVSNQAGTQQIRFQKAQLQSCVYNLCLKETFSQLLVTLGIFQNKFL